MSDDGAAAALARAAAGGIHRLAIPTPFAVGRVNTYLIDVALFMSIQLVGGLRSGDTYGYIFPYFLMPSGLNLALCITSILHLR